jgi:hypothetical protein
MLRGKRQFAAVLGSAMAIALLTASTAAEAARKKSAARSGVSTQVQAPRASYGYQVPQGGYDRFNVPPGGGINFNDGRLGANWTGGAP